jgi:hypothetical protein
MLKPIIPEDGLTGVLWATAPDRGAIMQASGLWGPDGQRKDSAIKALVEMPKDDFGKGRIARPNILGAAANTKAWWFAEYFNYGNLSGLSEKKGETVVADLRKAVADELNARAKTLGDPASADVVRFDGLTRLAAQYEKAGLKDEGKALKTALKAREADKEFKNELTAFKLVRDVTNVVCNQRKAERDKALATYKAVAAKYASTWGGMMSSRMVECLTTVPNDKEKAGE